MMVKKKRPSRFLLLLILFSFLLPEVTEAAVKKNITLSLFKREIKDLDSSGLYLVFYVTVANSSSNSYYLSEYNYRVVIQDTEYLELRTNLEEPILIEGQKDTLISFPVKFTYSYLFQRIPGLEKSPKISCYLTGLMIFTGKRRGKEKVPFAYTGEFPVYKDLEVELLPLRVKALSVGGTEFIFDFNFRNRNDFELALGKMSYLLELEGRNVSRGEIGGEKKIEAEAERKFSLSLILDFFEMGQEFLPILQQSSLGCFFSGETVASTIWGDVKISFAQKGSLPVFREYN